MAIDLTTTKYCCNSDKNFRLPIPPTSMCRHKSCACSGCRFKPSSESKYLHRDSWAILSSPCASSAKSSSGVTVRRVNSSRKHADAVENLASTIDWHALHAASIQAETFLSRAPSLLSSLVSSSFASNIGPLATLPILACCSFRAARVCVMFSFVEACSLSAASSTDNGVAKASSSAPCNDVSGKATSSSSLPAASVASTLAAASLKIASATFLSRISMCAFFSASSFLAYSLLESMTFFFSWSRLADATVIFGLSFANSFLASASGPFIPAFVRSAALSFKKLDVSVTTLRAFSSVLSISVANVMKGVISSRKTVPPFPSIVTKPVLPLDTSLHSSLVMPVLSSFFGFPRASTTTLRSTLPFVLLFAISNTSVNVICCLQMNCLLNICLKSAKLIAPSLSAST
mmetsp:Transcript_94253/g.186853  ORF Transcript_94253/g.186853 Transcript_94253/m.186853 type:complete len:404 (-) Transcript_94253:364-1575(-)